MKPQIVPQVALNEHQDTAIKRSFIDVQRKRHEIRMSLLLQAAKSAPKAVSIETFHQELRRNGFDVTAREIDRELHYLFDKGMVVDVPQIISPQFHCYRIHASGTDYLAEQGLEDD